MKKEFRHIEDFLEDQSFRKWVLEKDDAERQCWESWIKSYPEKKEILLQARTILLDAVSEISEWEKYRKPSFLERVDKSIGNIPRHNRRSAAGYPRRKSSGSRPKMIVGAVLLLTGMAWHFYNTGFFGFQQENPALEPVVAEDVWITKSVPVGQKSKLHLSDGSIITLNSSSQIQYKDGFGIKHRDIFLEGESFFEVAPDSLLPFRVFAKDLVTTALGTSFNIRNYDEKETKIQLATGSVEVHQHTENGGEDNGVLLEPGEEVLWKNQQGLTKRKFDLQTAFLWKDGVIYFQKTPFSEVITILERWYGVKIHVEHGSHNNRTVSGEFKNDYLTNVLETIQYTVEFDYQISGKDVNIFFKD